MKKILSIFVLFVAFSTTVKAQNGAMDVALGYNGGFYMGIDFMDDTNGWLYGFSYGDTFGGVGENYNATLGYYDYQEDIYGYEYGHVTIAGSVGKLVATSSKGGKLYIKGQLGYQGNIEYELRNDPYRIFGYGNGNYFISGSTGASLFYGAGLKYRFNWFTTDVFYSSTGFGATIGTAFQF